MKEAFWGVLIIVLGLFGVVVNLFQSVIVDNDVIEATENPTFYVDRVYKEAKKLKTGYKLQGKNGSYGEIMAIELYSSDELVYNIKVENNHNYYVGNGGYLVHNRRMK